VGRHPRADHRCARRRIRGADMSENLIALIAFLVCVTVIVGILAWWSR
jgi:uncharacterized Tic20 family protein